MTGFLATLTYRTRIAFDLQDNPILVRERLLR